MKIRRNGFTLIETLLVLTIFLVMSFASTILLQPVNTLLEKQLFFSQLKSDFLYAQQYAISRQEEVTIHIMPEANYYYIRSRFNGPMLIERHYSPGVKVRESPMNYFQFTANGNTNKFGSLYVEIDDRLYRMTMLIGRGRFYVVEE
ncbi:competence type IV pilus minor pilin ComGD [Bacillus sp. B15-48]|uniref:competence type IV pilus minor pilin ComGD n=1 Tax=Bacillus sp. B15-48 TaxID=1548601 RepID=UPI00193F06E3|nr:competence type IV pilus minor pilin ComGD [Bacillus sp. B15-48]MBM4762276.1 prepilin-type N-terminal cleavage/methylation domain-containing protein [Bacillus sp. B15-48]